MKLNKPFVLQDICDMQVAVSPDYQGILNLSPSGAYVFDLLREGASEEELLERLCEKYDAPRAQIQQDLGELLGQLREAGLIDE